MGSRPWKESFYDRLSPDHEGERLIVIKADGVEVVGEYVGAGHRGDRMHLLVSAAPEGMGVRHPNFFDYEEWVPVERGMIVRDKAGETLAEAPSVKARRSRG